jgi:hypothetical protein
VWRICFCEPHLCIFDDDEQHPHEVLAHTDASENRKPSPSGVLRAKHCLIGSASMPGILRTGVVCDVSRCEDAAHPSTHISSATTAAQTSLTHSCLARSTHELPTLSLSRPSPLRGPPLETPPLTQLPLSWCLLSACTCVYVWMCTAGSPTRTRRS